MLDRFVIADPDPALRSECDRAIALVRAAVPDAEVLEVGSTAVPGVIGKGDVDLLVRVPLAAFEATREALDRVLPRNPQQLSDAAYQGYTVPSPIDVAVQLTVKGGEYDTFVEFLDALRADPALVERYNALKREWDGQPMDEYRAAKAAFIEAVLR
jgi:GrpB-like predicted nucleotidyltransferase (UPF0157 family)